MFYWNNLIIFVITNNKLSMGVGGVGQWTNVMINLRLSDGRPVMYVRLCIFYTYVVLYVCVNRYVCIYVVRNMQDVYFACIFIFCSSIFHCGFRFCACFFCFNECVCAYMYVLRVPFFQCAVCGFTFFVYKKPSIWGGGEDKVQRKIEC